eukprot:scaffold10412_cov107-Isochrysis_galbana.AAC.10
MHSSPAPARAADPPRALRRAGHAAPTRWRAGCRYFPLQPLRRTLHSREARRARRKQYHGVVAALPTAAWTKPGRA